MGKPTVRARFAFVVGQDEDESQTLCIFALHLRKFHSLPRDGLGYNAFEEAKNDRRECQVPDLCSICLYAWLALWHATLQIRIDGSLWPSGGH